MTPLSQRIDLFAGSLLVAVVLAAYWGSFAVPFVFDDLPSIVENPSIRHLGDARAVLGPQEIGGLTVSGRPFLNLSLALNYWIGGTEPWSYHAVNLVIHLLAGLFLLGVLRRTLLTPLLRQDYRGCAHPLALAVTALWLLHPMQVESVTYVIQRAESLCALLYLATLYTFLRACDAARPRWWLIGCWVCCAAGMATKEVMVSAPIVVLLYDRTFLVGTFRDVLRRHGKFHLALGSTWILLAYLVATTADRGGTAGFTTTASSWDYLLTQCHAIVHYLWLAAWPDCLSFDYGLFKVTGLGAVWPQAVFLLGLLVATLGAMRTRSAAGFAGACFFLLLAPSSSVFPVVTQTMAEHRLYLALAPVLAVIVLWLFRLFGPRLGWALVAAALALALSTHARNGDYRDALTLWGDTVTKRPDNARAYNNFGQALFAAGRVEDSIASYHQTLALQSTYAETHYNLGVSLAALGRLPEAIASYETALRLQPGYVEAHNNLGNALAKLGRWREATAHYERAIEIRPSFAEAHNNLGNALLSTGRGDEAAQHFRRALGLRPHYPEARYNLGNVLAQSGQMAEALVEYRAALQLRPDYAEAHVNAGNALLQLARPAEAIPEYQRAIALAPSLADAHYNLGSALLALGRWAEAVPALEAAVHLNPAFALAHRGLGFALVKLGRPREALPYYEVYARAFPGDLEFQQELAEVRRAR